MSAGELSGDLYAARLVAELRRRRPAIQFAGMGGPRMQEEGVELAASVDRLAVMGLAEVVSRLPYFLRLRRRVHALLVRGRFDLVVLVDYPGFNLPLARYASRRGIPVLYYVAPQVWAWGRSRAGALAAHADRVCTVLPFEAPLLARAGVRARFVGHPLLDEGGDGVDRADENRARSRPVLGLFPGSREQEVRRMLEPFVKAGHRLEKRFSGLRVEVARAPGLADGLFDAVPQRWEQGRAAGVASRATAAITKSGTVTLELALADAPMVVGHRVHPLTAAVGRRLVGVEHVALVNLIAGRQVVPELLQDEVRPEALARSAAPLLEPGDSRRREVREGLAEVRGRLGEPGVAGRVADCCKELLQK